MRNSTRQLFNALVASMAKAYGVSEQDVRNCFSVSIPMETKLNNAVQESADFLQRISMMPVTDKKGQALKLSLSESVAKRTNTKNKDREGKLLGGPDGFEYECKFTEFDIAIVYDVLDAWARFPDFLQRYMNAVYRRIALDRIKIGFHGTSAAVDTTSSGAANLSDVNVGWLKIMADYSPENFLTESKAGTGKITLGAAGDYKNLDQLTYDVYSMIPEANRSGSEVAIVGRGLVANDMGKALAKQGHTPTEKGQIITLDKSYGTLPALVVPHFPENGVLVTDTENLHLYYQENGVRRQQMDNPKRNRVEDFISSNDAYALEDLKGAAAIDASNLEFKES